MWRRWQDWAVVVLGAILFASAHSRVTATPLAEWTALVIGVLMFLVGLVLLTNPRLIWGEWVQLVLGALLFVSPWVFGYQTVALDAWIAWVIGVLAVLVAGSVPLTSSRQTGTA
jgi:hypothetical protein